MKRLVRYSLIAAGVAAVMAVGMVYWLFYDKGPQPTAPFPLTLAELRQVAGTQAGPVRVEIEQLSHTPTPKIAIVAGSSWDKVDMVRASYRLVFRDRTILIDTANSAALARQFNVARYDAKAWTRLVRAMDTASAIVVTHEHADHMGGLLESPHPERAFAHAVLTREQLAHPVNSEPLAWPRGLRAAAKPLHYDRLFRLAPGVVLIKTPGHTAGSQMVYVRRADGQEYIFMGDTASLAENVTLKAMRSRYVTHWYHGGNNDDRAAVNAQITALHDLQKENPKLVLVPGHDGARMDALIKANLLVSGFRF